MRHALLLLFVGCGGPPPPLPAPPSAPTSSVTLRPLSDFEAIADEAERSSTLFRELGKVLHHPRCANCHPADDRPRQGADQHLHEPPVWRGEDGHGEPAMHCSTCHGEANGPHVPGAPHWHLAPAEMAWLGTPLPDLCAQLKDPARNGGKDLDALHAHFRDDALVAWAWSPGAFREPAPGSPEQVASLVRAWIDSGAHCPEPTP